MIPIAVRVLPHGQGIELPSFQTPGSAGADVRAAVPGDLIIAPGTVAMVPTGLSLEVPEGFEVQVRPRSGLAANHRIGLLNSPGTVDPDYRGEVKILMMNFGTEPFLVRRGDRIAQLVLSRFERFEWKTVDELGHTTRGAGGFGHTGQD